MQSTYVVEVRGGALAAHVPGADAELATVYALSPTIVDEFADTAQAVPFASLDDHGYLKALEDVVGEATVVSFGEANHNAHEFLTLRNRVFRHLVEERGFTAFAAETDYVSAIDVDRYVNGEIGWSDEHANAVLSWSYAAFAENRALIDWLREYNHRPTTTRKVRFYGLEAAGNLDQDGRGALLYALEYARRMDTNAVDGLRRRVDAWQHGFAQPEYRTLSASLRDRMVADLGDLVTLFEHWHVHWIERSSQLEYHRAYRAAIAARQVAASLRIGGGGRWRKLDPPQHPLHSSLGEHANETLGRRMVVIGSSHFAGVTRNWLDLEGFDNRERKLEPARIDSFDAVLSRPGRAFDAIIFVRDIQPLRAIGGDGIERCIGNANFE